MILKVGLFRAYAASMDCYISWMMMHMLASVLDVYRQSYPEV